MKLELDVEDVDYGVLLDKYLPLLAEELRASGNPLGMLLSGGMPAALARGVLQRVPQEDKDRLAADMVNQNAATLARRLEETAREQGIPLRLRAVRARTE